MSLLVTSSQQNEFDGISTNGLEQPNSYTNIMRSPLIVEPDSEIALVSLKCNRSGNYVISGRTLEFALYWGQELTGTQCLNTVDGAVISDAILSKNRAIYIRIPIGTYTKPEFIAKVQSEINTIAYQTYSNFNGVTVDEVLSAGNAITGLKFTFVQNASATDKSATLLPTPCINANNDRAYDKYSPYYVDTPLPNSDKWTHSEATKSITCSENTADDSVAVFSLPLSSASGVCEVDFTNSSGTLRIGLVRNLASELAFPRNFNRFNDDAGFEGNLYHQFYDYVFHLDRDTNDPNVVSSFGVAQSYSMTSEANPTQTSNTMKILANASYTGGAPPGKGKLQGAIGETNRFSIVRFTRYGEKMKIELVNGSTSATQTLADHTLAALCPVNMNTDQLYLKVQLTRADDVLVINKFSSDSGSPPGPYSDRFYGFGGESDSRLTKLNAQANYDIVINRDINEITYDTGGFTFPRDYTVAPTYSDLNGSGGQDRSWVFVMGPTGKRLSYQVATSEIPVNVAGELGFTKPIILQSVDKDASSTLNSVVFKSTSAPNGFQVNSMFIRFHATQQNSFNSNTGSVSKIVYACPRFDVNGTQDGPLYFEPNERVYLDMNNPSELRLTNMAIDIVDVGERLIKDLDGSTQINFHIRKKQK